MSAEDSATELETFSDRLNKHLALIYTTDADRRLAYEGLARLLNTRRPDVLQRTYLSSLSTPDETTVVVSAYPDHVLTGSAVSPLRALSDFLSTWCPDLASHVHLLPFHPSSSDDGFAVEDYARVDPNLGDWEDLRTFSPFQLVVDAVVNHVSSAHEWAVGLRAGAAEGGRIATGSPDANLTTVVRPRTSDLLLAVQTAKGVKHVWCTFSHDQWDLDYQNPDTLVEVTSILLDYVDKGAAAIRLDAVGFLWKEPGTASIHLPETHELIRLWRTVLDAVAPDVLLLTETNVPHAENVSYLGNAEAQLAYHFALPPVTLDAFLRGDATHSKDLVERSATPAGAHLVTFLASHDGIGVRGAEGLLTRSEVEGLVARVRRQGALVTYRSNPQGDQPYEINSTYFDALEGEGNEPNGGDHRRFVAAHAVMLAQPGVPAIYLPSLFGARNWADGPRITGQNRSINRRRIDPIALREQLEDKTSLASRTFQALGELLRVRRAVDAFHPDAPCSVLPAPAQVFALQRISPTTGKRVLCLHNVSGERIALSEELRFDSSEMLVSSVPDPAAASLAPYEYRWFATAATNSPESPRSNK